MLNKALITLKKNPMVILFFILALVISAVPMIFLLPDINRIMTISNGIPNSTVNTPEINPTEVIEMLLASMKLLLFSLVTCAFDIIFVAGFGNMLAAAVNEGKASLKIFLFGIKKFFGKTLLSVLLLAAIIFGFSLVISVIAIPFTLTSVLDSTLNPEAMLKRQKVIQLITGAITVFLYPFAVLWLPAIFLDRNDSVLACFRNAVKAGVKKYVTLLAAIAVMMLPVFVMFGFSKNIYSTIEPSFYIVMYIYQAAVMPILLTYLFTLYNNLRQLRPGYHSG